MIINDLKSQEKKPIYWPPCPPLACEGERGLGNQAALDFMEPLRIL